MAKATFFMMASDVRVFRFAFKKIDEYNIVKKNKYPLKSEHGLLEVVRYKERTSR